MIDVKKPLELFNPNRAAHKVTADCSLIAVSPSGLIVIEHNLNGQIGGVAIFTSEGASYKSCPAWTLRNKAPEPRKLEVTLQLMVRKDRPNDVQWGCYAPGTEFLNWDVIGEKKVTITEGDKI